MRPVKITNEINEIIFHDNKVKYMEVNSSRDTLSTAGGPDSHISRDPFIIQNKKGTVSCCLY